jgi:hypothetical protein
MPLRPLSIPTNGDSSSSSSGRTSTDAESLTSAEMDFLAWWIIIA